MFNKLLHLLQKPALWQRSAEPFWDDEHISKGMLEAHLNPDWDAASRKHSIIDCSVKWLTGIIPSQGKILDLGCGPGMYTKRLSDMGYSVTGMDFSRRSIEYAKFHDVKTEYVCGNYLELSYTNQFDAVLLIYGDYAALTPYERQALIPKAYQALKTGGLFILDVFTKKQFLRKADKTSWMLCDNGGFWSAEPYICLEATYFYDNDTVAVDQHIVVTDGGINEYLIWDTAYTVQKLTDEVSPFGFKVNGVFDDVCGSPYTGAAETLCFVLESGVE
jgi:SAM-dependent methyltransferase